MTPTLRALARGAAGTAALGLLAACGNSSGTASGSGSPTLAITSPASGAAVGRNVQVAWNSSEQLGPPSSGKDHVHIFVDGHSNDYTVVGGNSFMVKGLSPGKHTIDITLQNADHSSAGADDKVDVTVKGAGGGASTPSPTKTSGGSGRYGY
ncbi:MAG: hypothetical protein HOQ22_12145 [Nocardioidaceae bacterium]|nr:hypothetical protein [Nocardioidaceae bacterium]